jgi:NitT/TauT family transport system substrate-binding protein
LATLQGSRFLILSQVVERTITEVRVVARRDGQLIDAGSYFKKRKRKLATSLGGGPEFFTYNFLKKYGIAKNEVEIISQKPEDMPAALANGSVDAISIFDPFAYIGEKQLGDKAIVFADPDIYSELYVITVHQETLDKNPGLAEKMMRALVAAQQYVQASPDDSQAVVAKYTKLQPDVVRAVWKSFVFAPALTPLLLDYQTKEAAWAKETGNLTAETVIPDFRKSIHDAALRKVKPESVRIP